MYKEKLARNDQAALSELAGGIMYLQRVLRDSEKVFQIAVIMFLKAAGIEMQCNEIAGIYIYF